MQTPKFLTEDNGKPSTTRLMSFISLIASITISFVTLLIVDDDTKPTGLNLVYAFLASATCPKLIQKKMEAGN